ncbi:MAG TPA: hypothetical protein VEO73_09105 [Gemmatimonadales bacterium]|nr:hypothetical protein [Gemmatimonadales bacterium]
MARYDFHGLRCGRSFSLGGVRAPAARAVSLQCLHNPSGLRAW